MGGANNICSDKTGTLTTNIMTVANMWTAGKVINVKVNDEKYQWQDYFKNEKHFSLFKQNMSLNTIGDLKEASATEKSMLVMMQKMGVNVEALRNAHLGEDFIRF